MKLGVPWTSKGKKGPERSAPYDDADTASVHERLDDLTRQLERLSRITASKFRPPDADADTFARDLPQPDPAPYPYSRLDQRLEQFAVEGRATNNDIERYAGDRTLNRNPLRPIYSDSGLDQTLAEIAARQRFLDGQGRAAPDRRAPDTPRPVTPPSQNLSGLEEQLRTITTQIEALRRPCAVEEVVPALRQELADISRSLAEAMPRRAIETIEAEVRGLAERLDHSRQSGVDAVALGNIERGLAEVRDALRTLTPAESLVGFQGAIQGLARKVDGIAASQRDPVVLQQLESAVVGLRGVVAHVASDDTLARLTEEVRGIAARIERTADAGPAPDTLTNLERRVGAIADAITQSNAHGRQVPAQLESVVQGLSDKIEKLQLSRGDTIAFGQLEDRITKLVEKLDASGSRLGHLEAIERGLADVLVHLEEQRARGGTALRAGAGDPAVDQIKRDLEAVNGTLNRVVDRLATIETGIRGGIPATATWPPQPGSATTSAVPHAPTTPNPVAVPAVSSPPAQPVAPAITAKAPILPAALVAPPIPVGRSVAPPSERLAAAARAQRPAAPRERSPIDPNLPPDHPLEPGAVRARATQSPADRIAASEAALGPAKPPVTDPGRSNFIAAARRAAQTALRTPPESDAKDSAPTSDIAPKASLRQRLTGRVRSMLVGAGIVILIAGALRIAMTLVEPHDVAAPGQATSAQPPAILPPPESTARVLVAPMMAGPAQQDGNAVDRSFDAAPASGARSPSADDERATTGSPPPGDPPPQIQEDVTGSIPAGITVPGKPATVPLPPSRRDGEGAVDRKTGLAAAAAADNPAAAYELAVRHIEGRGVPQSYETAVQWLGRASKHGLAPAQFRLGSLYEKGLGVKKDLNAARRLYAAAAERGSAKAMHNLAVLHAEGIDGKPDYQVATQWFRKAADRGVADSQYNLGVLCARGVGVEQNLAESYKWFALAAQQGDQESGRKRDDIAARLGAESLMAARLAVKTWVVVLQPDEATTVKTPPGGWDQDEPLPQAKRRPRNSAPLKLRPG
ncbi:MAG: hypothetical protein GEU91_06465 [Rhizobiales bacterium]|nr:hypothetical protein [Hyphomicrobiales bacterium]